MAILQMQKFSICALKTNRQAILDELQSLGVTELNFNFKYAKSKYLKREDTSDKKQIYDKNIQQIERALEIMDQYDEGKKSLLAGLEGKDLLSREEYTEVLKENDDIRGITADVNRLAKVISTCRSENQRLEGQIEALTPWMALDVPMNCDGTEKSSLLIGSVPGAFSEQALGEAIAKGAPGLTAYQLDLLFSEKTGTYFAVTCLKTDAEKLEHALREIGFVRPSIAENKVPEELAESYRKQIEENNKTIENSIAAIRATIPERKRLEILSDEYRVKAEKYRVLGEIPQSRKTFFVTGYLPVQAIPVIEKKVIEPYGCAFELGDIKGEAPVLLKNNPFSRTYEGVLESYGLPHKGEFDPTVIMSVFYAVFFGMMLSDFGYGLLLFIGSLFLLLKFPRMEDKMRQSIKLFCIGGISTMFWGIMYGSYFGDIVDTISREFFGHQVHIPALWFEPLNDPMRLLVYCLIFGLIHLFMGVALQAYNYLKKGKVWDFICDDVFWYAFLIGLILMLLPTEIMASIIQKQLVFPDWLNLLARILAIAGAVGIILFAGRRAKKPVKRILLGIYDIYGITGWLSDVLSYSRLLALGMATGVIASVVNMIGTMFGSGVIKLIIFIVVFIVGTALSLFINTLGAYVHSNRLEFVEFFGKFYEGGGRPFEPFKKNTKYVDVKEEN